VSKKYRGKVCAYCCTATADAGDHVFSREFFAVGDRANLPKAPICVRCNTRKSTLEQYVLSTLVLGNLSAAAQPHHTAKAPRRLGRNPQLRDKLLESATEQWIPGPSGLMVQRFAIPIDGDRVDQLFAMVVRGLAWHHWSTYVDQDAAISVHLPHPEAEFVFTDANFDAPNWRTVSSTLGRGTINYRGWQAVSVSSATAWRIDLLGGVAMGGGDDPARHISSMIGVMTIPAEFERLRRDGA
jgi:hypothetical protein